MSFLELNAAVADLRSVVAVFVRHDALREINIRPPVGSSDEASFVRLVAWSYVLNFEVGRVTIPYLLKLPSNSVREGRGGEPGRELVRGLRTWTSHNLGFADDSDLAVLRRVHRWFLGSCGTDPPVDSRQWEACFRTLCEEVAGVIGQCRGAMDLVLRAGDDGERILASLRRRIERAWPAQEFDKLVVEVGLRIGVQVNSRKFCETRLSKWRRFVEEIPEGDDPEQHVIRVIERDLLDQAEAVLPIGGTEVMETLNLTPGPEVGEVLRELRELWKSGKRTREELLSHLRQERKNDGN